MRWIIHRVHDVTHTVLEGDTERTRRRLERERQPIVQALRDANRELAEMEHLPEQLIQLSRLNSIALMSATIAHDMRQPLTAAKTYAATLQRALASPRPGVDAADLAAKVERQIDRSIQIVSSMRSFLTGTRSGSCPDELDDLVGEAVVLSEFAIRDRGVQIVNAIPGDLPRVMVERAQIQQVLINLIVNAAEAMAQSVTRQVRISAEYLTAEKMVRIDVADSGPGLAPEVAANMFRPFTTTKRSGMGLGLSICREIVKAHGGQIWTAPNQPNGTVFAFTLPLADPQSSNALLEAG